MKRLSAILGLWLLTPALPAWSADAPAAATESELPITYRLRPSEIPPYEPFEASFGLGPTIQLSFGPGAIFEASVILKKYLLLALQAGGGISGGEGSNRSGFTVAGARAGFRFGGKFRWLTLFADGGFTQETPQNGPSRSGGYVSPGAEFTWRMIERLSLNFLAGYRFYLGAVAPQSGIDPATGKVSPNPHSHFPDDAFEILLLIVRSPDVLTPGDGGAECRHRLAIRAALIANTTV